MPTTRAVLFVLLLLVLPAAAAEERRVYATPAEVVAAHEANQAIPKDERQWVILSVPGGADACEVEVRAQYPMVRTLPAECRALERAALTCHDVTSCELHVTAAGLGTETVTPCVPGRRGTHWAERVEGPLTGLSVLLHGLGGRVEVEAWCEGPGGAGAPLRAELTFPGPLPPERPEVQLCSHPVARGGETVCEPR